jgi:hypothetical protein
VAVNRKKHLEAALAELRTASRHMAEARDWLFDLGDVGAVREEVSHVKTGLDAAIAHVSRQVGRE